MPRKKKSRKVGLIGVRKDPNKPRKNTVSDRIKKPAKGKPAGSRHNVETGAKPEHKGNGGKQDPRLGSKKPIQLIKTVVEQPTAKIQKRKYATPAEELAAIEADDRLASLLDKLDDGQKLTKEQASYVEQMTARHQVLCDLMGIKPEDDEEDSDKDPLDSLDAFSMDDFK